MASPSTIQDWVAEFEAAAPDDIAHVAEGLAAWLRSERVGDPTTFVARELMHEFPAHHHGTLALVLVSVSVGAE